MLMVILMVVVAVMVMVSFISYNVIKENKKQRKEILHETYQKRINKLYSDYWYNFTENIASYNKYIIARMWENKLRNFEEVIQKTHNCMEAIKTEKNNFISKQEMEKILSSKENEMKKVINRAKDDLRIAYAIDSDMFDLLITDIKNDMLLKYKRIVEEKMTYYVGVEAVDTFLSYNNIAQAIMSAKIDINKYYENGWGYKGLQNELRESAKKNIYAKYNANKIAFVLA